MGVSGVHGHHGRGASARLDVAAGGVDGGGKAEVAGGDESERAGGRRRRGRGRGHEMGRGHAMGRGNGHRKHGCGGGENAGAGAAALDKAGTGDSSAPAPEQSTAAALGATTPVGAASATPGGDTDATAATDTNAIAQVARDFSGSPIAQQVLQLIVEGGAAIDVVDDAAFQQQYGRASGIYDPKSKRIALPQSVMSDPEKLRIVLLHEGVHWVQDNTPGGIAAAGGPIAQALQGAGALRDVNRNSTEGVQVDEAQAFLLEAIAARQAGIADPGLATRGGAVIGFDEVVAAVRQVPEYQ